MTLKILSWNIWRGQCINEVIRFIKNSSCDVICLQEAIEKENKGKIYNTAEYISSKINYNCIYYKASKNTRHSEFFDQGNAILSKYKIIFSKYYVLNKDTDLDGSSETDPKIVVQAIIKSHGKELNIYNTQLSGSYRFLPSPIRTKQIKSLSKILNKERSILCGDFNCSSLDELEIIKNILPNTDMEDLRPTFPVFPLMYKDLELNKLTYRLDNVYTSKDILINKFKIHNSSASDHLPVSVIIEF